MSLKVNDLISVIKNKIEQYNDKPSFQKDDQGYVVSVGDGIAFVYGLSGVMYGELVLFEKERIYGLALNLEENLTGVIIIGSDENIREYDIVKRQNELIKTSFDQKILGSIINVFGESIYGDEIYVNNQNLIQLNKERRELKKEATNIMMRESVSEPLETGILAIDALIPIGKGQRELIIGDRQTGKTSIAIDTIINQKDKNVLCIYVAIGQKKSDIVQIVEKLKQNDAFSYTVVLAANAADPVALQYLAPYTGASIAEAWMLKGKNVLIVYDDLSKHANAYRTLSLLLRRPPGREAYPGDIFYLHASLLERAAKLSSKFGGGSITAFPIVETQAGDISSYIPTNIISITDGQLFLSSDLFIKGIKPAINVGLSVSRIGSAAQTPIIKSLSGNLKLELSQYFELQIFTQFSGNIEENTKKILEHGKRLVEFLKQNKHDLLSIADEIIFLLTVKKRLFKWLPLEMLSTFKVNLIKHFQENNQVLYQSLNKNIFDQEIEKKLVQEIKFVLFHMLKLIPEYNYENYGKSEEWKNLKLDFSS